MTGPGWLLDGLAVVMIATAVYCACHLVLSWVRIRHVEPDVDLMHVGMGIAMAGMIVAAFGSGGNARWGLVFAGCTGWFALRAARALRDTLGRAGHHVQHLLACGAMVYMLVGVTTPVAQASAAASGAHEGMAGMAGMGDVAAAAAGSGGWPTVSVVLAAALLGCAGWSLAELVLAAPGSAPTRARTGTAGPAVLAPRLALCCQFAMSVTMGYLLLSA